jgi:RNA-directed DNA polymerase
MEDDVIQPTNLGVPQGGPLSPILANIFLHQLDLEAERCGMALTRYADDMVVMTGSRRAANRRLHQLKRIAESLGLKLNLEKSKAVRADDLNFLGYSFRGGRTHVSDANVEAFKKRIRSCLAGTTDDPDDLRPIRMRQFLHGWLAHFGRVDDHDQIAKLARWYHAEIKTFLNSADNKTAKLFEPALGWWSGNVGKAPRPRPRHPMGVVSHPA